MAKEIKKDIDKVLTSLNQSFSDELFAKKEPELEDYWHFKWDETASTAWNTYQFFSMLELYKSFCQRWEEHHNGSCCIVERVRDKYLIPKIKFFVDVFRHREEGEKMTGYHVTIY